VHSKTKKSESRSSLPPHPGQVTSIKKPLLDLLVVFSIYRLTAFAAEFRARDQLGRTVRTGWFGVEAISAVHAEFGFGRQLFFAGRTGILDKHLMAAAITEP
jgi:hypothetical protein